MKTNLERFLTRVGPIPADPNDCWEWLGRSNRTGYGLFEWRSAAGKTTINAHRAGHLLFVSEDVDGLHIDHLCGNRRCVNPLHLEAVTAAENTRRRKSVSPPSCGTNSGYTHGCRCELCRLAHAEYQRGWNRRKFYELENAA